MVSRIVSFLPSSTEILCELGMEAHITGVTHECNYPDTARKKPRVVNAAIDSSAMSSKEIDGQITKLSRTGGEIYILDRKALRKAMPDLIIAQGVCKVCAPHTTEIERAFDILGYKPEVLVLDPHDLHDILENIHDIARKVNKSEEGLRVVTKLRQRIRRVEMEVAQNLQHKVRRPRIICIEWIDPLFVAGHWIPGMVEIAGGINGLSTQGEPSRRITLGEISQYQPDKIVLMPCGLDVERTCKEMSALDGNSAWKELDAVKRGEVYVVNANAYFSKPGPRIVMGLEILAKIIDPVVLAGVQLSPNSYAKLTD